MMYNMYLAQELENETLVLKFPELPDEIEPKCEINNKRYNVLALGDVIRIGKKGLKNFTLISYYPADKEPAVYVTLFEKMVENMVVNEKPIRFILNRINENKLKDDINILVVIDSFSHKEEGGEVGDIYFSYKFTEYREHKAKVIASV